MSRRLLRTLPGLFAAFTLAGATLFATTEAHADDANPPHTDAPHDAHPSCALGRWINVSPQDAEAIADIVCTQVRQSANPSVPARVHVVRIGSKHVVTLETLTQAGPVSKEIVLQSLDEITIAAPRLVEATETQKTTAETVTMTNVVSGDETRPVKKKPSFMHAEMGMLGAGSPSIGAGAGMNIALGGGSERWSFIGDLRVAGAAFNSIASTALTIFTLGSVDMSKGGKITYVSLTGGARHHLSADDIAPFVGMGLGFNHVGTGPAVDGDGSYSYGNTYITQGSSTYVEKNANAGLAFYGELGLDILRTRNVGGTISLRADAPTFTVETVEVTSANGVQDRNRKSTYAPIMSAGIALRFQ